MSKTLFNSSGGPILLGHEIGRGGEGAVYEISSASGQVAKVYQRAPDQKKQAKLKFMASTADAKLLSYVAWPQDTLHQTRGGPVVGFLMPRVNRSAPVHMVYSPAHRKQDYPKAAWDFLLYVARNIAASFETIHVHGHVIGDVNQSGVMVSHDTKVVLIDADSFQITAKGVTYLCEVGVPHFTPPELQRQTAEVARTKNHDNFGLALLIFHVLFGGRHPFSGRPLRNGVGDVLEADIREFRYAYARDSKSRGLEPPPNAIPVSILPESMESMFHLAFTERGASGGRPTALQWLSALDHLRGLLRKCSASSMHMYPNHLAKCPWCALEQQSVFYFIDLGTTYSPTSSGFVITRVWALIEAEKAPAPLTIPVPGNYSVKAQPLPEGVPGKIAIGFYRVIAIVIAVGFYLKVPALWWIAIIVGFIGLGVASEVGSSKRTLEKGKRSEVLRSAQKEYSTLVDRVKDETGPEGFNSRRSKLSTLRDEFLDLPKAEKQELDTLRATAVERQKRKFLEKFFIDSANISGIGPGRRATLRSFGIETAADVDQNRVMQIRGFGWTLTSALLDWKVGCERRFVFNPALAVTPADVNVVRTKFAARRAVLERALTAGPGQLQQFRQTASSRFSSLKPQLDATARNLAQAHADLSLL